MNIIKRIKEKKMKEKELKEKEEELKLKQQLRQEAHEEYVKILAKQYTCEEIIGFILRQQELIDTYKEVLALKVESH